MKPQSCKSKGRKCQRCKMEFVPKKDSRICLICKTLCSTCGVQLTSQNIHSTSLKKRSSYRCKECVAAGVRNSADPINRKDYDLRRNYGITLDEYNLILDSQNGLCWICQTAPTGNALAVDHKHRKNERKLRRMNGQALIRQNVRGLLCWKCNAAIGKLGDNPDFIRRAATYIESWPAQQVLMDAVSSLEKWKQSVQSFFVRLCDRLGLAEQLSSLFPFELHCSTDSSAIEYLALQAEHQKPTIGFFKRTLRGDSTRPLVVLDEDTFFVLLVTFIKAGKTYGDCITWLNDHLPSKDKV